MNYEKLRKLKLLNFLLKLYNHIKILFFLIIVNIKNFIQRIIKNSVDDFYVLVQGCEARDITIIRGSIGKDHIYMLIGCSLNIESSKIVQYLK